MPQFERYIGIEYSEAKTPTESLRGLRVYAADWVMPPREVPPPPSPRKYWTRRGLAEWLVAQLSSGKPMLVGIDHGFSFPLAYFQKFRVAHDWPKFLDDFQKHWPTDAENVYVNFVRDGLNGNGAARLGNSRWRRLTEFRAGAAKSVFHFDCQGSVAKSTHAGLPWLRFIRQQCGDRVHFWPFDGRKILAGRSVRRSERNVFKRMFGGAEVRDGAKAKLCIYNRGDWSPENVCVAYKNPKEISLKSADVILVCKRKGRVLYEGSVGDER